MHEGYVVLKLVTGEELIGALLEENDYEITIMMPMVVRYIPKLVGLKTVESILLAPFTQFADDDMFTFQKHSLIFLKNMDKRYIQSYEDAVDMHLSPNNNLTPDGPAPGDAKAALDKLTELFGEGFEPRMDEDEYMDQLLNTDFDTSKKLH